MPDMNSLRFARIRHKPSCTHLSHNSQHTAAPKPMHHCRSRARRSTKRQPPMTRRPNARREEQIQQGACVILNTEEQFCKKSLSVNRCARSASSQRTRLRERSSTNAHTRAHSDETTRACERGRRQTPPFAYSIQHLHSMWHTHEHLQD